MTATLPPPPGEFAIIAGVRGTPDGFNPLIDGDDDGTVALSETHLDGVADRMTVPGGVHSFLMGRRDVTGRDRAIPVRGAAGPVTLRERAVRGTRPTRRDRLPAPAPRMLAGVPRFPNG